MSIVSTYDYSTCVPDRVTEMRELLASDAFDKAVRALTAAVQADGYEALELDFLCGVVLRVTPYQAIVVVPDATPEIMEVAYESGRNFTVAA